MQRRCANVRKAKRIRKLTKLVCVLTVFALAFVVGCQTHRHIVGDGAQEWDSQSERQWYILGGLIPLNDVQTEQMAGDVEDYEIKTETTFVDGLINLLLSVATINVRTVTVTK